MSRFGVRIRRLLRWGLRQRCRRNGLPGFANTECLATRRNVNSTVVHRRAAVYLDLGRLARRTAEHLGVQPFALVGAGLEDVEPGLNFAHVDLAIGPYRRPHAITPVAEGVFPQRL